MKKRLMCMILSILMLVSILPIGALADDGGTEGTQTTASATESTETGTTPTEDATDEATETTTEATTEPANTVTSALTAESGTEGSEATEGTGTTTSSAVAKIGGQTYESLSAAISAATSGNTVELLGNVSETTVTVDKSLTIDLNTYTLSTTYVYVGTSGVEVTVKNGTITGTYGTYVTAGTLILDTCTLTLTNAAYAYGGELKLESTTLTSTSANRAINCYDSSTVTIDTNSTVNCDSGNGVVIWGDASANKIPTLNVYGKINADVCVIGNGTDYSGTVINIGSGAVLTATTLGMYLPQPCTVTITDATVTGLAAIGIKSGTLTISGSSVISGTGTYDSELTSITNGINTDGSAIIIDSYSGYAGNVTVNISGTPTISSANAVAIREISNSASTNVVSISISGGTVTSGDGLDAISVTDAAEEYVTITGGTYSSDVSTYTTDKLTALETSDGTYSIVSSDAVWDVSAEDETSSVMAYATVNSDGKTVTLHITGTGDMKDYDAAANRPWHSSFKAIDSEATFSKEAVTAVEIAEGVTKIGAYAFSSLMISHAIIPSSVKTISANAFSAARPGTGSDGNYLPVIVYMVGNTSYTPNSTTSEGNVILAYLNGGSLDESTIDGGDGNTTLATPTKDGDTFGGWYRNSSFSGMAYTTGEKGKVYYAKWNNESSWDVSAEQDGSVLAYVTLNDDGSTVTLHITGTGAMKDFTSNDERPWHSGFTVSGATGIFAKEAITNIVIDEGVTYIGALAFCSTKVSTVVIPASVVSIGENAFAWVKGYTSDNINYLTIVYLEGDTEWELSSGETAYVAQAYLNGTALPETLADCPSLTKTTSTDSTVLGWYTDAAATGEAVTTATAGSTYYACHAVASVTSGEKISYYETFDEAIAAATTDGDTITLLSEATWTLTASQTFTIGLTFDLNGHTLTLYSSSNNRYVTFNPSSSESTVAFVDNSTTGGGKVIGSYGGSYGLIRIMKACSVILKNVTFENTSYGYAIELGNSSYDLNITAENCTFVNSNTTNKSSNTSSTIYSRSALVYGNKGTDTTKKISFYGCTFKTESTNGGAALQIQGGADGTNSVITIDNCQIISNGTSTSAYALSFSTNLYTSVDITNSIIQAASGACAANFAYSIKSTANLTFGEGNTVTGMLRFGNSSSPVYVINVTGGCFSYTVDGVETNPFVAATATESAVSVSSLLNLTGGYFKTSVLDVVANGYTILANTQEAAGDSYNSGYADAGYDYVVTSAANATGYYTVSNGMPYYYQSLESALSGAASGDTVYFAENCELSSSDINYINEKSLTITNHGSVTITYGGTLSELVSALTSGTVSVQTLAYKYDDTTNHSMTNAVIANGKLTGGLLPNMVYTDSGIWNYYNDSTLLTESYVICRGSYGWTIASASSKYAAKVDNIYFSDYYLGEAVRASIKLNALDSSTHVVTLVDNATSDIEVSTAGATLVLDLGGYTLNGHVYLLQDNITATISNGSITNNDSKDFVISTNGMYTGVTLTLDEVKVTNTEGYAMYLPADGSTTITNCTINSLSAGIEIRAGDLTITDSIITASDTEFGTKNNGSGTTVYGAGIAVSQHTTNHEINVTITDSVISGYYGIFEVNYNSSNTSEVNINISGDSTKVTGTGTGAAAIYSVSVSGAGSSGTTAEEHEYTTVAVSGGSFSSAVPEDYCATGYEPTTQQADGTYSVKAGEKTLGISDDAAGVVIADDITGQGTSTLYAEVKAENISGKYDTDSYPTTSLTYTETTTDDEGNETTTTHNYIFAGWYTSSDGGTTYTACTSVPSTDAYAKFVDANVLSSGAQILDTTTSESETTAIRFVSTVDDLDYIKVGFVIHITGKGTATVSTTSVYQKILGSDGETELSYEPTCFSSASQYFDVYTLTGVPNEKFSSTITVTAYWVTLDGTTVYGSPYQFKINDKIAELNNTSQG